MSGKRIPTNASNMQRAAYVLIAPSFIVIMVFYLLPLISSVVLSTMKLDIFLQKIVFTGLENYAKILGDERFWNALGNTLYFTVLELPVQIVVSLLLASYLAKGTLFRKTIRTTLFIPVICSMTAMGIVWSLILDPAIGFYPHILRSIGMANVELLRNPATALPTVAMMTVWKNFGMTMVILMAGIQGIPKQYFEAAEIDGAGRFHQLVYITIPSIIPALGFCVITTTIDCLKIFDQVYVMTQGGPLYSTETIVQYIYNRGFRIAPFNLGYASAIAQVLLVLIAATTIMMFSRFRKEEVSH
jgi:multiple sugar transport system permease protein